MLTAYNVKMADLFVKAERSATLMVHGFTDKELVELRDQIGDRTRSKWDLLEVEDRVVITLTFIIEGPWGAKIRVTAFADC